MINNYNSKEARITLAEKTMELLDKGEYEFNNSNFAIKEDLSNNKIYSESHEYKDYAKKENFPVIKVYEQTTTNAAETNAKKAGLTILNFASATNVGGGFLKGSSAQEESICYRSNLYKYLVEANEYYNINRKLKNPLYTDTMVYTKNVIGFRNDYYNFVTPYVFDVLTCPAVMAKVARTQGISKEKVNEVMLIRIRKIIKNLIENNSKTIVLGAFGCGAFGNDIDHTAKSFYTILIEEGLAGYFDEIIFAIYDKYDNSKYKTFKRYFEKYL